MLFWPFFKKQLVGIGHAVFDRVKPFLKEVGAERTAGKSDVSKSPEFLDVKFNASLDHLAHLETDDSLWNEVIGRVHARLSTPDYLAKPSIQNWLREADVRRDLVALARSKLLPGSVDEKPERERLADRYAFHTMEAPALAIGAIESVTKIMLAGVVSHATEGEKVIIGLVQDSTASVLSAIKGTPPQSPAFPIDDTVARVLARVCTHIIP